MTTRTAWIAAVESAAPRVEHTVVRVERPTVDRLSPNARCRLGYERRTRVTWIIEYRLDGVPIPVDLPEYDTRSAAVAAAENRPDLETLRDAFYDHQWDEDHGQPTSALAAAVLAS